MGNDSNTWFHGGATPVASGSFASKLALHINIFCDKKMPNKFKVRTFRKHCAQDLPNLKFFFSLICFHRKLVSLKMYENLGIGSPHPSFFSILSSFIFFEIFFSDFFCLKSLGSNRIFNFRPHLLKSNLYVGRQQTFLKTFDGTYLFF